MGNNTFFVNRVMSRVSDRIFVALAEGLHGYEHGFLKPCKFPCKHQKYAEMNREITRFFTQSG